MYKVKKNLKKSTLWWGADITFHVAPHNVQLFEFLWETRIQSNCQGQVGERAEGHQGDLRREHSVTPGQTADAPCRALFHLALVLSRQTDHRIDCILFLDPLFPPWVSVFKHIPKSIGSKVVSTQVIGSNQGTSAASKDRNLQYVGVLICNIFVLLLG